jgi:predicted nucleic acid-binding protein
MACSTLEHIPDGSRVFLDANVFIYHFTGVSTACRDLLRRCEDGLVTGVTSVLVLAEVAHRLMMLEAVARGLVSPGNVARKLRERPEVVRQLTGAQAQVDAIDQMGVEVQPLDPGVWTRSADVRRKWGLLMNDSLIVATCLEVGLSALASADLDFERVEGLHLYTPGDLAPNGLSL